ncbi:YybS family protein [Lederbergia citrea]|uniref:YybS family protein n=1 Tax=Lederbergia citrea TaxID=2833581 RepID=A0A942UVZ9_9BACI|nr:YybS family protein [Lederbergia citrea]
MKKNQVLIEGASMLAIFILMLLLSLFIPLVSIVVQFFLILPFLLYSAKYPVKYAAMLVVAAVFVSFVLGSYYAVPLALLFGTTGLMMGYCIRSRKNKLVVYLASSMVFLANILLFFAIAAKFFGMNFLEEISDLFKSSVTQYTDALSIIGQSPPPELQDQLGEMIRMMNSMAPTLLLITAFITVLILMAVNFPIIKRLGIAVPKFEPFRLMKFPKSILWYYLIALVLSMLMKLEVGSYWYMALVNAAFILQTLLVIQGLSFIFYYNHIKKWPKFIPILAVILTLVLPFILSIVRVLGIIDIGFNLRQRLNNK